MLGGVALKQRLWVAYGVLLVGAVWCALTASGALGGWAKGVTARVPPVLILTAVLAIPILAALCSLHVRIDWRVRIALFAALLSCVPLLPVLFDTHPIIVVTVAVVFVVEEFGIIPLVNKRWMRSRLTHP